MGNQKHPSKTDGTPPHLTVTSDMIQEKTPHLLFRLHDKRFGLSISTIREIVGLAAIARLKNGDQPLRGNITVRGIDIPLTDITALLDLPAGPLEDKAAVMVLRDHGKDSKPIGIVIDEVLGVAHIASPYNPSADRSSLIKGELEHEGQRICVLSAQTLRDHTQI